ncbi:methyltransferase domain-containing protein [Kitasatospora sp. NPDC096128]|uniref:methyltransferase domain-containing protein n=1 Tax=Kitasatospora sp. NPDC096128 TaxID=3155547 RepID=UPI0033192482
MSPTTAPTTGPVRVLDPLGDDYRSAFEAFLTATDQKSAAQARLSSLAAALPARRLLIDVGAGEGGTTRHLAPAFTRTIAVEPSAHLHDALRRACPSAALVPETVAQAEIGERADLVLCSHVLYYLPRQQWLPTAARMLEWVADDGELAVLLQNPASDCLAMVRHFTGATFDLTGLRAELLEAGLARPEDATVERIGATIRTTNADTALAVAEFMLNLAPLDLLPALPPLADVRAYITEHFADHAAGFSFTCDQDLLRIRRPGASPRHHPTTTHRPARPAKAPQAPGTRSATPHRADTPTDAPRYDTVGDLYRQYKTTAALPVPEQHLFRALAGNLTGHRVLDLATGYGAYARLAHDLGAAEVVGVDLSPQMVRHARAATDPSTPVTYQVADALDLPDLGTFDLVTAVWLLNYAHSPADLTAMAAGAARALRPGGRLVAITVNPGYDPAGPDWTPYGLTLHRAVPATGRHLLDIALLTPAGEIPLSISQWDAPTHRQAFHEAGLRDLTWHLPAVPDRERADRTPDFWDAALANPFLTGLTATR